MCHVAHLLGENVADVVLARDMKNFDGFVLNPLAHRIFPELDVASGLQCHVVGPQDAGVVVVEHFGGSRDVAGHRHTAGFKTPGEIPGSYDKLAAPVGDVDLRFA